jgi:ABC-2 type transport system permease protein
MFGPHSFELWLQFGQGSGEAGKALSGRAFEGWGRKAPWRWLASRELLALWRVPAQRLQALFLASLVGLFVFNLSRLPLGDDADLKQYLFVPLCAFAQLILVSVAARFVFPAGSLERPGAWLLFSAPLGAGEHLKAKLFSFGGILFALSLALAWAVWRVFTPTGVALLGGLAGFVSAPWILASLNLGLGIAWAREDASGPDEVISSPAGVLVMVLGAFYVLGHALLMAVPMYEALRMQYVAHYQVNKAALGICLFFWLALQGLAFILPLRAAVKKIEGRA